MLETVAPTSRSARSRSAEDLIAALVEARGGDGAGPTTVG